VILKCTYHTPALCSTRSVFVLSIIFGISMFRESQYMLSYYRSSVLGTILLKHLPQNLKPTHTLRTIP